MQSFEEAIRVCATCGGPLRPFQKRACSWVCAARLNHTPRPEAFYERLETLVRSGMSYRNIGRELGMSKDAAIGIARRRGLRSPPKEPSGTKAAHRAKLRRNTARAATVEALPSLDAPQEALEAVQPPPAAPPVPVAVPRVSACAWPIGEPRTPDFHQCEAPVYAGGPYCPEHMKLAYVKHVHISTWREA